MAMPTTRADERGRHRVDGGRSRRALGKHIAGAALGAAPTRLGVGGAGVLPPLDQTREGTPLPHPSLQRIVVDGTELEYEERGSGEPVLLIHGGLLADAFAPLLAEPALTDRYRVISYHRRGFAGSARPEGEVSIARQAADARALLAHLGIARAHVVGHSYGGYRAAVGPRRP